MTENKLNQFSRTELLLGSDGIEKLKASKVAIFGIGGVGGYCAEALVRAGLGNIELIDDDRVCLTNINRQIIALRSTVGQFKVDVMENRLKDINPDLNVKTHKTFFMPENSSDFDFSEYDYVVDAIDTVKAKIELVVKTQETKTPIVCAMGAGNKLDATKFEVADIYKTSVCPLARVMLNELKKRKIKKLKVVYSKEPPLKPIDTIENSCKHHCICPKDTKRTCTIRRQIPGSISYAPSVMGLIIAQVVIQDLLRK